MSVWTPGIIELAGRVFFSLRICLSLIKPSCLSGPGDGVYSTAKQTGAIVHNHRKSNLRRFVGVAFLLVVVSIAATSSPSVGANTEVAFDEKFMLRLSSYNVVSADTDIAVFGSSGIGTSIDFDDDLGGDNSVIIPRIDGHYRFDERHRIDFSSFRTKRDGSKVIEIDLEIGDETFSVGERLDTEIKFALTRVGYGYSFYHSPTVELSFTAGLNINSYDFDYGLNNGASDDTAGVSAPLPTFGLRLGYKITPKWYLRYVSETFFIEIEDTLKGTLLNYELDLEYRVSPRFTIGAGISRISTDLDADDDDWKGRITDSNRGFLLFGAFYW